MSLPAIVLCHLIVGVIHGRYRNDRHHRVWLQVTVRTIVADPR